MASNFWLDVVENIVTITLLILTLFGKIEYKTFEIPNTREDYHGLDGISWSDSNAIVCSSWYERNVKIGERKNEDHFKIIIIMNGMVKKLLVIFVVATNTLNKVWASIKIY